MTMREMVFQNEDGKRQKCLMVDGNQHFLLFPLFSPTESILNPLPDDKILDWSKLKRSAEDNFEFDVNSRKFSKLVENTVGKGEIARYEQFLLFPVFSKGSFPRGVKRCHCVGMG